MQKLHLLGARKVVFHGLGPLGCAPSQRVKSKKGECLKRVNDWVMQFNSRVRKLLQSLTSELPDAGLAYADIYTPVMDLIQKPQAYGIHGITLAIHSNTFPSLSHFGTFSNLSS